MTIADVIASLRAGGHTINIYKRPDGGVRVTGIDGSVFSASSAQGNALARTIAGEGELSQTQRSQRMEAGAKAKYGHKVEIFVKNEKGETVKVAKPKLSAFEKARLRRLNRLAKITGAPKVGMAEARKRKGKHGSTRELWEAIKNNIRKKTGLGFSNYAGWLIERFNHFNVFQKTSAFLSKHSDSISYSALERIHDVFYSWLTMKDLRDEAALDEETLRMAKQGYAEGKEIKEKFSNINFIQ